MKSSFEMMGFFFISLSIRRFFFFHSILYYIYIYLNIISRFVLRHLDSSLFLVVYIEKLLSIHARAGLRHANPQLRKMNFNNLNMIVIITPSQQIHAAVLFANNRVIKKDSYWSSLPPFFPLLRWSSTQLCDRPTCYFHILSFCNDYVNVYQTPAAPCPPCLLLRDSRYYERLVVRFFTIRQTSCPPKVLP